LSIDHFSTCRQIGRLMPSEVRPTTTMPTDPITNRAAAPAPGAANAAITPIPAAITPFHTAIGWNTCMSMRWHVDTYRS
jgi:hypothetical protein